MKIKILDKFLEKNEYNETARNGNVNKNAEDKENNALVLHPDILNESLINWSEEEFKNYKKNKKWFLIGGSIVVSLVLIMLAMANFVGAFTIALTGFVAYVYALKDPQFYQFAVHPKGIAIGSNFYNFNDIESFWIFERDDNENELVIKSEKFLLPRVYIPISQVEPNELRGILSEFLPEEEEEETLIDLISRKAGF